MVASAGALWAAEGRGRPAPGAAGGWARLLSPVSGCPGPFVPAFMVRAPNYRPIHPERAVYVPGRHRPQAREAPPPPAAARACPFSSSSSRSPENPASSPRPCSPLPAFSCPPPLLAAPSFPPGHTRSRLRPGGGGAVACPGPDARFSHQFCGERAQWPEAGPYSGDSGHSPAQRQQSLEKLAQFGKWKRPSALPSQAGALQPSLGGIQASAARRVRAYK